MNSVEYQIVTGLFGICLGSLLTIMTTEAYKLFFKRKFNLENIREIILRSNSNIKIINKASEKLNNEVGNLNEILIALENAKR